MKCNNRLLMLTIGVFFVSGFCAQAQETPLNELALDINAVSIVLNDEHRTGVDWEAIVSDFHALTLKKADNPLWSEKKYKLSVGTVSDEDYAVLLDALDTVGVMTQVKQPSVTLKAEDKQQIAINLQDNKPGNDISLGLMFKNDGQGLPVLDVEPAVNYPLKEEGKVVMAHLTGQTQLTLADRNTMVLGSIISEQEITKTHKFPLLGSLPIVGFVFRSQGRLMQRIETIVFITPRVKALPVPMDNNTQEAH